MSARRTPAPATLRRIVEIACRAPSVHNTQPWLWQLSGNRINLYADTTRQLLVADDKGRNLTISCGAALHHARTAAGALGLRTRVGRIPDPADPNHLAVLELVPGRLSSHALSDLRALEQRCTDRRRFTAWPMSDQRVTAVVNAVSEPGVHVAPITDVTKRLRLELLLSRAMTRQESDPRYAEEQRHWIDHSIMDGVPAAAATSSHLDRGLRQSRFTRASPSGTGEIIHGTDGVVLIGTDGDDRAAWLGAGEALSALWMHATTAGLSVVPLSQIVEIEETRLSLHHDILGGMMAPQALVRIGWQTIGRSDLPRTPRRPVDDVLIT